MANVTKQDLVVSLNKSTAKLKAMSAALKDAMEQLVEYKERAGVAEEAAIQTDQVRRAEESERAREYQAIMLGINDILVALRAKRE